MMRSRLNPLRRAHGPAPALFLAASIVLVAGARGIAAGGDEGTYHTFRPRFREGDRITRESKVVAALDLSLRAAASREGQGDSGGGMSTLAAAMQEEPLRFQVEVEAKRTEEMRITSLEAGRIARIERDVAASSLVERVGIGEERHERRREPPVVPGHAEIEVKGERATIRPDEGGAEAEEEIDARLLPETALILLPLEPRREEGDTWPLDASLAASFVASVLDPGGYLGEVEVTRAEATLDGVQDDDGEPVATITASIACGADLSLDLGWRDAALADLPPARWESELEVTLRFALDRGIPLGAAVEGTATIDPAKEDSAGPTLEGEGTIHLEEGLDLSRDHEEALVIAYRDREGASVEKTDDFSADIDMEVHIDVPEMPGGGPSGAEDIEMTMRAEHSGRQRRTVLAAEGGKASKVRLEILEGSFSMQMDSPMMGGEAMDPVEQDDPLAGEVLDIERDGDDVDVSVEGGSDAPQEVLDAYGIEPEMHQILPPGPVEAGETWTLEARDLAAEILPIPSGGASDSPLSAILDALDGQIECTFEGIEVIDGMRCAHIAIQADVSADLDLAEIMEAVRAGAADADADVPELPPMEGSGEIELELTGSLYVALDEERPVRADLSGTIHFDMDMSLEIEGMPSGAFQWSVSGEGELSSHSEYRSEEDV